MAINTVTVKRRKGFDFPKRITSGSVLVGLPANSDPYPDGTSVVQVATDHEFGSDMPRTYTSTRGNTVSVSGIPERSFMRSTSKEQRGKWGDIAAKGIRDAITGNGKTKDILGALGEIAASDVKQKITSISTPPNSPQVIADKGSSNPLIDTGHMRQAITFIVKEKE